MGGLHTQLLIARLGVMKVYRSSARPEYWSRHHFSFVSKNDSSRITGKGALDLHEKELAVPVAVHPLFDNHDLYLFN